MMRLITRTDDAVALIDGRDGRSLTYSELGQAITARARRLAGLRGHVVFLGADPTLESVVDLLALGAAGATVAVLDPSTSTARLAAWQDAYRPAAVLGFRDSADVMDDGSPRDPLPESVLLPTSGSTGSAKFVRLTWAGLTANAHQIGAATGIAPDDRALVHLPLHFS